MLMDEEINHLPYSREVLSDGSLSIRTFGYSSSGEKWDGRVIIVPIELWHEINAGRETAYLLKSETMKWRQLEAGERKTGISFDIACLRLGL